MKLISLILIIGLFVVGNVFASEHLGENPDAEIATMGIVDIGDELTTHPENAEKIFKLNEKNAMEAFEKSEDLQKNPEVAKAAMKSKSPSAVS